MSTICRSRLQSKLQQIFALWTQHKFELARTQTQIHKFKGTQSHFQTHTHTNTQLCNNKHLHKQTCIFAEQMEFQHFACKTRDVLGRDIVFVIIVSTFFFDFIVNFCLPFRFSILAHFTFALLLFDMLLTAKGDNFRCGMWHAAKRAVSLPANAQHHRYATSLARSGRGNGQIENLQIAATARRTNALVCVCV